MLSRGLYAITDASLSDRLLQSVEAALLGGVVMIQYRDKSGDFPKRLAEATSLLALCHRYQRPLLINDDVDLALAIGADGVHLGQSDGSLTLARRRLGPDAIIGATCHDSLELACSAVAEGANYLAFGAFFPSLTKPGARPAHLDTLTAAKDRFGLPIVAIGGITRNNAMPLLAAGADQLAVISDLFGHPVAEIPAVARQFSQLFVKIHSTDKVSSPTLTDTGNAFNETHHDQP